MTGDLIKVAVSAGPIACGASFGTNYSRFHWSYQVIVDRNQWRVCFPLICQTLVSNFSSTAWSICTLSPSVLK